jgi:hypothetical protein
LIKAKLGWTKTAFLIWSFAHGKESPQTRELGCKDQVPYAKVVTALKKLASRLSKPPVCELTPQEIK